MFSSNFQKKLFYLFLALTVLDFLFTIFVFEEKFEGKYGFQFPDDLGLYTFLALVPAIALTLAAKLL